MFVFVYGSLKKDFKFHYLLEDQSIFIGKGKTLEKFSLFKYKNYDFPYMKDIPCKRIKGELYEIDSKTLKDLDLLEGYPNFYDRKQIYIICNNIKYSAYTYFLNENINENKKSLEEWTLKD